MLKLVKGTTAQIEITVDENITAWKIKAKLYDSADNSLVLATSNITGGADTEIEKTTLGAKSVFVVKVPYDTTTDWEDAGYLEIKIDTGNTIAGKAEILPGYKGAVKFEDSELDWDVD